MPKSLACPNCEAGTYVIVDSVELGRNLPIWDEKTIQRGRCETCKTRFFSVYEEQRSFHMDREDKVSHVAAPARAWVWRFAGLVFLPPVRQKSPEWRCKVARFTLQHGVIEGTYLSIRAR